MSRPRFDARKHISSFNSLRVEIGEQTISLEELKEGLASCGCPKNISFVSALIKAEILIKGKEGIKLTQPKNPIHYEVLQKVYEEYLSKVESYNKKYIKKIKDSKKLDDYEVKHAIKLLKSKGFVLYAPVGDLFSRL